MLNKREIKELAMIAIIYRHGRRQDAEASARAWLARSPEARKEAIGDALALLLDAGKGYTKGQGENAS